MEDSSSWENNMSSTSQEIRRIVWNPKVYYRIHKRLTPALSWARVTQFMPLHRTSWTFILILFPICA